MKVRWETNTKTRVPCVNSCCAHRCGGPEPGSGGAASPGRDRRGERSFPPCCSRRTHRGCHAWRKAPPRSTWRAMIKFPPPPPLNTTPRTDPDLRVSGGPSDAQVVNKSATKTTFPHRIGLKSHLICFEKARQWGYGPLFLQTVYLWEVRGWREGGRARMIVKFAGFTWLPARIFKIKLILYNAEALYIYIYIFCFVFWCK